MPVDALREHSFRRTEGDALERSPTTVMSRPRCWAEGSGNVMSIASPSSLVARFSNDFWLSLAHGVYGLVERTDAENRR